MNHFGIRFFLMQKRMFKKISYLAVMVSLPLLVAAMKNISVNNREMLTIALVYSENADELVEEITEELTAQGGVFAFERFQSKKEAREAVAAGKAAVAWIFPDNLAEKIHDVALSGQLSPVVTCILREKTASLELTKEILSTALYPAFVYEIYKNALLNDLEIELSEEELEKYFEEALIKNNLFEMDYLDGKMEEDVGYLMSPVRGMMAVWLVLCGIAANMYYLSDEKNGVFAYMPISRRWIMALAEQGVVMLNAVAVLLISLKLSGVFTSFVREVVCLVLFALCSVLFCAILRELLKKVEWLGFLTPILMAGMFVLCPVFLRSTGWKPLKFLLPPYFYLNSIHNNYYIYGMIVYLVIAGLALAIIKSCKPRPYFV